MKKTWILVCLFALHCLVSPSASAQTATPLSLDRINQRTLPLDGNGHRSFDGMGVTIYVIDNGVNLTGDLTHDKNGNPRTIVQKEFLENWRSANPGTVDRQDAICRDHGTRVASVAAGRLYGVAPNANIVSLRVGPCYDHPSDIPDSGVAAQPFDWRDIVAALDWVSGHGPSNSVPNTNSVVNISLAMWGSLTPGGSEYQTKIEEAIQRVVARGIVVTGSATYGSSACSTTPARVGPRVAGALTVSASNSMDEIATNKNVAAGTGDCIEFFAPAGTPATRWDGQQDVFEDTSCATAVVSGAVALVRQQYFWMKPADFESILIENATMNVLKGAVINNQQTAFPSHNTANRLLYTRLPLLDMYKGSFSPGATKTITVTDPAIASTTYQWSVTLPGTIVGSTVDKSVTLRAPSTCTSDPASAKFTAKVRVVEPGDVRFAYMNWNVWGPSASFNQPVYITPGQTVTLSVPLTGVPNWNVEWSDGFRAVYDSSPARRTVEPQQTTTYTFRSISDATGCPGLIGVSIPVTVTNCLPPPATVEATSAMHASAVGRATVTETTGASYQWTVENGSIWSGQGTTSIQYIAGCSGTTTVRVTVTASCGTASQSSATTTLWEPRLTISGGGTIAPGETAVVTGQFSGTKPWQITWSDGVRITSLINGIYNYEVMPATTTTYTATFKDKRGCTGPVIGSATVEVQ